MTDLVPQRRLPRMGGLHSARSRKVLMFAVVWAAVVGAQLLALLVMRRVTPAALSEGSAHWIVAGCVAGVGILSETTLCRQAGVCCMPACRSIAALGCDSPVDICVPIAAPPSPSEDADQAAATTAAAAAQPMPWSRHPDEFQPTREDVAGWHSS